MLSSLNEKKKERAYDSNDIILGEDDTEDESMKKYTSMLLHSVNNSENYGKGNGLDGTVSEFVEKVDNAMFPIQGDGWFREGMKKTRKTKYLMIRHPGLLSHTYLQTHPDGVLHGLPGWTRKLLIYDLAYRFGSSATTQHRTAIPILGGLLCTVKTYSCAGVVVCKQCSSDFRETGRHTVVNRTDQSVLACAEELSPAAEAKKEVVGMYLWFEAKKKTRAGFCQAEVQSNEDGVLKKYTGSPIVVPSTSRPGSFFVGCTGFSPRDGNTPRVRQNEMRNLHYASRISQEGTMLDFFRDLMSGKQAPSIYEESSCTFVRGKHKSKDRCPRHGCELVKLTCKKYPDDKHSSHTMSIIEPAGYHEDTPDEQKVLFVSCIGEHMHPAPPPVEATAMKLRIFDYLCAQRKCTSLAQLRKTVGLASSSTES